MAVQLSAFVGLSLLYLAVELGVGVQESIPGALLKASPIAILASFVATIHIADEEHQRIKRNTITALCFSIIGDITMSFDDLFNPAMAVFAMAYLRIFKLQPFGGKAAAVCLLMYSIHVILCFYFIDEAISRWSIILYAIILFIMLWRCVVYHQNLKTRASMLACAGGIIFFCSDVLIAGNRYVIKIPFAHLQVMILYYTAQFLLALSVGHYHPKTA